MKKVVSLALISVFLMLGSLLLTPAFADEPIPPRPNELYVGTIEGGNPETVDPAWCYDTASAELIFNVYDTLISVDGEHVDMYLPMLATEWTIENITGTTSPEGLPWYFRYTFKIREGVYFHDGSLLTPADVEYSIEREMVQDRDGGPQWMFYEPLLDTWGADGLGDIGNATNPGPDVVLVGKMIDHAVESNDTHVWFNLAFPGAYAPFLQILGQTWASILSKTWVNDYVIGTLGRPEWSGDWGDYTDWINYHNPEVSPLDDPTPIMCGTGPYEFVTLSYTDNYWQIQRNPDYWGGWPADFPAAPYPSDPSNPHPAGYVDVAKVTWAYKWSTREAMFLSGDLDFIAVPRENIPDVLGQPGVRCIYPLPELAVGNLFYTFDIDPTTPYGTINDPGVFSEDGIPSDFFGNPDWGVHVRKAFSYAFDYDTYLEQAFLGEAIAPATAIIPGLACYDPSVQGYYYDLSKAAEEFQLVPDLWDTGFTITICYNTGNIARQRAAEMLETNIESINSKFHVDVLALDWGTQYLPAMVSSQLSCFIIGWLADYPDPHNFAFPFYHSQGTFAEWQKYSNPDMDALIEEGIRESDPDVRCQIYHDIQVLAVEDCPSVPLYDAIGRHFERNWVVGWYHNVIYPGFYFYTLWKWYYAPLNTDTTTDRTPSDVNYDGKVDMMDIGWSCLAYGSTYGPPQHVRWNFRCDVNNDRKVDMMDIGFICLDYGKTSATWSPQS